MDYVPFNEDVYNKWVSDGGDLTLRLTYPLLNEQSVVIDAGGYRGDWTDKIFTKYKCNIFILEPMKDYYSSIAFRFDSLSGDAKIIPINVALLDKTQKLEMCTGGDSSSIFIEGGLREVVQCVDVKDFFEQHNLSGVDLIKINIEGSEYALLERIIKLGLHKKIKNFQIQFHRFIENCDSRRKNIQKALSETHVCTWNYDWIWENWEIK